MSFPLMRRWLSKRFIQQQQTSQGDSLFCRAVKLELDLKLGCSWQVVVGSAFSLSVEHQDLVQLVAGERYLVFKLSRPLGNKNNDHLKLEL